MSTKKGLIVILEKKGNLRKRYPSILLMGVLVFVLFSMFVFASYVLEGDNPEDAFNDTFNPIENDFYLNLSSNDGGAANLSLSNHLLEYVLFNGSVGGVNEFVQILHTSENISSNSFNMTITVNMTNTTSSYATGGDLTSVVQFAGVGLSYHDPSEPGYTIDHQCRLKLGVNEAQLELVNSTEQDGNQPSETLTFLPSGLNEVNGTLFFDYNNQTNTTFCRFEHEDGITSTLTELDNLSTQYGVGMLVEGSYEGPSTAFTMNYNVTFDNLTYAFQAGGGGGSPEESDGGECGGSVPCSCGDMLVSTRVLTSSDNITQTVCNTSYALLMDQPASLDCSGFTIQGNSSGTSIGLAVYNETNTIAGGSIANCTFSGFATGLYMENVSAAGGFTIQDNVFENIIPANNSNEFVGNLDTDFLNVTHAGFFLRNVNQTEFINNTIRHVRGTGGSNVTGIHIVSPFNNNEFFNNTIDDLRATNQQLFGIIFGATDTNQHQGDNEHSYLSNTFDGNTITNLTCTSGCSSSSYGIFLFDGYANFERNLFTNNTFQMFNDSKASFDPAVVYLQSLQQSGGLFGGGNIGVVDNLFHTNTFRDIEFRNGASSHHGAIIRLPDQVRAHNNSFTNNTLFNASAYDNVDDMFGFYTDFTSNSAFEFIGNNITYNNISHLFAFGDSVGSVQGIIIDSSTGQVLDTSLFDENLVAHNYVNNLFHNGTGSTLYSGGINLAGLTTSNNPVGGAFDGVDVYNNTITNISCVLAFGLCSVYEGGIGFMHGYANHTSFIDNNISQVGTGMILQMQSPQGVEITRNNISNASVGIAFGYSLGGFGIDIFADRYELSNMTIDNVGNGILLNSSANDIAFTNFNITNVAGSSVIHTNSSREHTWIYTNKYGDITWDVDNINISSAISLGTNVILDNVTAAVNVSELSNLNRSSEPHITINFYNLTRPDVATPYKFANFSSDASEIQTSGSACNATTCNATVFADYVQINVTSFSSYSLNITNFAPTVDFVSPIADLNTTTNFTANVSFSDTDDFTDSSRFEIFDTSGNSVLNVTYIENSDNTHLENEVNVTDLDGDATYNLTATVTDIFGNSNTSSQLFTIDTTSPLLDFGSNTPTNATSVDAAALTTLTIAVDLTESNVDTLNYTVYYADNLTLFKNVTAYFANTTEVNITLEPGEDYLYNVSVNDTVSNFNSTETRLINVSLSTSLTSFNLTLDTGENESFQLDGRDGKSLTLNDVTDGTANFTFDTPATTFTLTDGASKRIDTDSDGMFDHQVELLYTSDGTATVTISAISVAVSSSTTDTSTTTSTTSTTQGSKIPSGAASGLVLAGQKAERGELADTPSPDGITRMAAGSKMGFTVNGAAHTLTVSSIDGTAGFNGVLQSEPIDFYMAKGETQYFDLDRDGADDIALSLEKIISKKAYVSLWKLETASVPPVTTKEVLDAREIREGDGETDTTGSTDSNEFAQPEQTNKGSTWVWVLLVLLVVAGVVWYAAQSRKK